MQQLDGREVTSAGVYDGTLRRLMLAFKEEGRTDAARALAEPLRLLLAPGLDIALMPGSAAARRRRGYDPVAVLAARLGRRPPPVLRLTTATAAQKHLDIAGRALNRADSMAALPAARGRRLLLLDDVVTTGATLREAARALRVGGAEVVGAVTVAATPRRTMTSPWKP